MNEPSHDNFGAGRAGDDARCWPGSVRVARPDDAAGVERVLRASYPALMAADYEAALLARALPVMTRASPRLLAGGSYFVAEMDELMVGCGGWSWEKPGTSSVEPGDGHIRHFATDAAWVGRGIGRAIYARCEATARAAGVRRLHCFASRNGEAFYAALGFGRIAALDVAIGPELVFPSIHMTRAIQRHRRTVGSVWIETK